MTFNDLLSHSKEQIDSGASDKFYYLSEDLRGGDVKYNVVRHLGPLVDLYGQLHDTTYVIKTDTDPKLPVFRIE